MLTSQVVKERGTFHLSRSSCAIVLSLTVVSLHLLGNRRSGVLKKTDRKVSFNGETLDDWGTHLYSYREVTKDRV